MKEIKILFIVALSSIVLFSCEKEIDLDLDESDQLFVIEGIVHDSLGDNFVLLSKTRPFDNNGAIEKISSALVQIKDGTGTTYNLLETSPGYYTSPTLQGTSGRTYELMININGEIITASSFMNARTEIDSITFEEEAGSGGGPNEEKEYGILCHFTDSLNFVNYYRMKAFLGNEQKDGFVNWSDDAIDGASTFLPVFNVTYIAGEFATIQLLSVDETNFRYFTAISSSQGGEVPGNPETNLSGDNSVGYFGAYAKSEQTILIAP
jgi:hypothetical protein